MKKPKQTGLKLAKGTDNCPKFTKIGQNRPKSGQIWPNLEHFIKGSLTMIACWNIIPNIKLIALKTAE